jgi:hypothetical protein
MFIAHVAGKNFLAPEERNESLREAECFAPPELESSFGYWFH